MSDRIEKLRDAVQVMHRCSATHAQSVPVREMFGGKVAWEGVVEAFTITGHPKAKRCYAWSYQDGKETQFVTVLEIPPVKDAPTAVRASIAAKR
ncbi:MAG: hypothetical protein Q8N18_26975 [Opitutaceae bacterium]|nr:hypothetical protein [Opitutaceae bacterium]